MVNLLADEDTYSIDVDFESRYYFYYLKKISLICNINRNSILF